MGLCFSQSSITDTSVAYQQKCPKCNNIKKQIECYYCIMIKNTKQKRKNYI